jgi:hypothetical protein
MTDRHKRSIRDGLTALALSAVVFIGVVFVAVHFGADLEKVRWRLVGLMCGGFFVVWLMYEWNSGSSSYDIKDLLMSDGKASLEKHIIAGFALLSIWVVIQQALSNKSVETLLLGVLGIFVLKGAAENVSNNMANKG